MFLIHTPWRWAAQSELVFADPGSCSPTPDRTGRRFPNGFRFGDDDVDSALRAQ
jgi:hypothetical protein